MFKNRKSKKMSRYVLGNSDSLNQREFSIIQHGLSDGIAKISLVEKKKKSYLVADTEGLLTLDKFLEGVISSSIFFKIVEGITVTILKGKNELLQEHGFDIGFDKIFISPDSKAVTLLYWPALDFKSPVKLDDFFIQLLNRAKLDNQGDDPNIRKFIEFFGSSRVFSLKNFAKLIGVIQNIDLSAIISDSKELFTLGLNDNQNGITRSDASKRLGQTETNYVPVFRATENLSKVEPVSKPVSSEATTVLGLEPQEVVDRIKVSLLRVSTGLVISVDQDLFTVGKQGCNYNIQDNNAISRNHAQIVIASKVVTVADLNSSNGTKVNGERIDAGVEFVLKNQDVILFANEEFVITIEDGL